MTGKSARRKRLNMILSNLPGKGKYAEIKRRARDMKESHGLKRPDSHIPASQQIT